MSALSLLLAAALYCSLSASSLTSTLNTATLEPVVSL